MERREADRCEAAERKAAAAAEKAERRASVKAAAAGARAAAQAAAAEAAYASDGGKSARRCEPLSGRKSSSRVVTSGCTHAVQHFAVAFTELKEGMGGAKLVFSSEDNMQPALRCAKSCCCSIPLAVSDFQYV